jgi:2-amino-4-hydroxy-6-hydroxymethyldihydropteridine diphosphokinase
VKLHRAYVGVGANLGNAVATIVRAFDGLDEIGRVVRRSALYRTRPWGKTDQPDFINAAVLLETALPPRDLLRALKRLESKLGRVKTERWGPRVIDLDLLAYDEVQLDEPGLHLPHAHLRERAFVLVPLAELDPAYAASRDKLPPDELQGVERLNRGTVALMPDPGNPLAERVRGLAEFLAETDAVRVRIERPGSEVEVARRMRAPAISEEGGLGTAGEASNSRVESIKADLVGIFHLGRPAPAEGELLDDDRELAFIEALGIRTPVRSLGAGRIVAIESEDGAPVEYGQPLFLLDRG